MTRRWAGNSSLYGTTFTLLRDMPKSLASGHPLGVRNPSKFEPLVPWVRTWEAVKIKWQFGTPNSMILITIWDINPRFPLLMIEFNSERALNDSKIFSMIQFSVKFPRIHIRVHFNCHFCHIVGRKLQPRKLLYLSLLQRIRVAEPRDPWSWCHDSEKPIYQDVEYRFVLQLQITDSDYVCSVPTHGRHLLWPARTLSRSRGYQRYQQVY